MARQEKITDEIPLEIVEQSLANINYKEVASAPMKITIEVSYETAKAINESARERNTAFEVEAGILLVKGLASLKKTRSLMETEAGQSLIPKTGVSG